MTARFPWRAACAVACLVSLAIAGCSSKGPKLDPSLGATDTSGAMASNESGVDAAALAALKVVYFPYDAYTLTKDARATLKANAAWLKEHPNVQVQIEGHCDERGSTEYNLALGEKRANAVKSYLTKLGLDGERLSIISYGKERPADAGHDETAWAMNRRAVSTPLSPRVSQAK